MINPIFKVFQYGKEMQYSVVRKKQGDPKRERDPAGSAESAYEIFQDIF